MHALFLLGNMSESKADQVEIREVDGQTLRKLVDYIYTAEIEVTEDNVQVGEAFLCSSLLPSGVFGFLLNCFSKTSQCFTHSINSFNNF